MDFSLDMCRVCLESGAYISIFGNDSNLQLYEKIMMCSSVQIFQNDGLPSALCSNCEENLNISYKFKQQCELSNIKLKEVLNCKIEQEIKEEINPVLSDDNSTKIWDNNSEYIDEIVNDNDTNDSFVVEDNKELLNLAAAIPEELVNVQIHNDYTNKKNVKKKSDKSINNFNCDYCFKIFKSDISLNRHHSKCSNNPALLTCNICNKKFHNKYTLLRHETLHKGVKFQKPKRHMCDVCGSTFHDQYGLNMHKRCHSGARPFMCNICGHGFSQQSNMERHIKAKHNKERPFRCEICSKAFAYSYVLSEHLKTHSGAKDYECSVCSRKFAKKFAVTRHMLTHTLERPFKCLLCEKSYAQSNDLKAHIKRTHEKDSNPDIIEIKT